MKNRLTVVEGNSEYTLGDFMRMRAESKKNNAMILGETKAMAEKTESGVAMLLSFVNDKLTIKKPPVKDKTIRAFPLRASFSALISAVVAASFMLCFGIIGGKLLSGSASGEGYSESMICEAETDVEIEESTVISVAK